VVRYLGTGSFLDNLRARRRQTIGRSKSATQEDYDRDGFVLQLLDLGFSYSAIARVLASRFGGEPVSRQAVQQRVKRLLLATEGQGVPRVYRPKRRRDQSASGGSLERSQVSASPRSVKTRC
jgi:hypothetical protein